jgi:Mn2+/Fe2+ NRAMP family transporter
VPKVLAVALAAMVIIGAAFTGSFRRFERMAVGLCGGSLLLIPIYFLVHPASSQMAKGFVTPAMPGGSGQLATVMLLVIGIVGTTVAPWQLFFQQSYVIDKRITPRFIKYEKADLWIGIVVVVLGAGAIMGFTAAAFAGTHGFGHFSDAAGLAAGLQAHAGRIAGVLFAVALLDASIIGAFAVSLSTAYALGDVFGLKHSLHRGVKGARGFYAIYGGLVLAAAAVVLIPGSPLGLLTEGVQALAGVLLPSAAVYLLLLCNDSEVLGPWVNRARTNLFTGSVVTVLVALSVILTASVIDPGLTARQIVMILGGVIGAAVVGGTCFAVGRLRRGGKLEAAVIDRSDRENWRMPQLALLQRPRVPLGRKIGMTVLRSYLAVATILVAVKIVQLALVH